MSGKKIFDLEEFEEPRYKNDSVAESSASLYTGAKWNLRDRVLGEVEKNSFIALPDKGGHSGLVPSKLCVPTQESLMRSFIAIV